MAAGGKKLQERTSYFEAFNPWGTNRSSTPGLKDTDSGPPSPTNNQTPANHSTTHLYGQSFARYPPDCPPLRVQWFHAVDVPKRKPQLLRASPSLKSQEKSLPHPKKRVAFSAADSHAIENAYQLLLEAWEERRETRGGSVGSLAGKKRALSAIGSPRVKDGNLGVTPKPPVTTVSVNEDSLFEVNIEDRELSAIYWLGPVYDVRRGTWFYQEGNNLRPCEENLAAQLEEGYLKVRPWTCPGPSSKASGSSSASGWHVSPRNSCEGLREVSETQPKPLKPAPHQAQTHRLFGAYINHVATYQDSSIAWLSTEGMFAWFTSYLGGTKLVRGYTDPANVKEESKFSSSPRSASPVLQLDERQRKLLKTRSASATSQPPSPADLGGTLDAQKGEGAVKNRLTRQLPELVCRGTSNREEEEVRKRDQEDIGNEYNAQAGETQGRDIEHLILITHGIGQLLSLRMDSLSFIHDINTLRKTLKSVYASSVDLRALNGELEGGLGNCKVQVLPVCWRHLLDFPRRKGKKGEQDKSEGLLDEDEYPSLDDITVEGMTFARSLISDLALDVLLYQSSYRSQISDIVLKESNRIYNLFVQRKPEFKGKVHIMGHSLGSAIMFDILCRQKENSKQETELGKPVRSWPSSTQASRPPSKDPRDLSFDFHVEDLYCLGSPIGLFQMLKGRTIAARHTPDSFSCGRPLVSNLVDESFPSAPVESPATATEGPGGYADITLQRLVSPITGLPFSVSSPKVSQLFNIFNPSDPVGYRLEPLISPMMRNLKPQSMPYTKKSIFGNMAPQGLTGIGVKVGQSFSGLLSSVSAGITTSFLNRSLGLTNEDFASLNAASNQNHQRQQQNLSSHFSSLAAGTGTGASEIPSNSSKSNTAVNNNATGLDRRSLAPRDTAEKTNARKKELASSAMQLNRRASSSGNELTLLDDELETLSSKFEKTKSRRSGSVSAADDTVFGSGGDEASKKTIEEEERRARKMRREEMKVRALNRNGRVDFCVQESALDYNPLNSLSSHLSYWSDEDVSHFILSQLLSNKSKRNQ